jgi:hypothetical protein
MPQSAYSNQIDTSNDTTKRIPPTKKNYVIATGMLGSTFISVVYVERGARRRIVSAFESDEDDIADYMTT